MPIRDAEDGGLAEAEISVTEPEHGAKMAGDRGLEPLPPEPESGVLPLY